MEHDSYSPPSDNEITHQLLRAIADGQVHSQALIRSMGWPLLVIVGLLAYIAFKLHG